MVGGTAEDLERARPVLEALARRIFHLGPLGSGAAMKLAVNTVVFGLNGALSEGLVLAERAGIDRNAAYDVLVESAVGAPYVGYKRERVRAPEATPTAFSLELAEKDLRLVELAFADGPASPCRRPRRTWRRSRQTDGSQGPGGDQDEAGQLRIRREVRRTRSTHRPSMATRVTSSKAVKEQTVTDRILIRGGFVLTQDPTLGDQSARTCWWKATIVAVGRPDR